MPRRTRRTTYRETPESSPLPLDDNESSQVHPDTTEAQNQVPLEEAKREGEAHAQQQPALLTAETDSQPAVSSPKLTREPTWDSQLGSSSSPMDRSSYHSPAWGAGTGEAAGYSVESIFSPPRPAAATTTTTTEGTSKVRARLCFGSCYSILETIERCEELHISFKNLILTWLIPFYLSSTTCTPRTLPRTRFCYLPRIFRLGTMMLATRDLSLTQRISRLQLSTVSSNYHLAITTHGQSTNPLTNLAATGTQVDTTNNYNE